MHISIYLHMLIAACLKRKKNPLNQSTKMKSSYFQGEMSQPLMGSSLLSELKQSSFFFKPQFFYRAKQVGSNIIIYKGSALKPSTHAQTEKQLANLAKVKYTGVLSSKVQKRMIRIVQNWNDTLYFINKENKEQGKRKKYEIIMLTLTLSQPQKDDDRVIKQKMLVPFLQRLTRLNTEVNYLWKAEKQKNGNIHFHILLDRFFDKKDIQAAWNQIQSYHGYHKISQYENCKEGAPSTRIERLNDKDNAISYVAKYITKSIDIEAVKGRLWGCNNELKKLKSIEINMDKYETIELVNNMAISSNNVFVDENYMIITQIKADMMKLYADDDNYTWNMAINMNKAIIRAKNHELWDSIESTSWFRDCKQEFGIIEYEYLKANTLLFGLQEYVAD